MPPKRSRSATGDAAAADAPAITKGPKTETTNVDAAEHNAKIIKIFEELMYYESKDGGKGKWASAAYQKVIGILRSQSAAVMSGSQIAHLSGVGKASVEKIDEFLETGTIKKLDGLKELHGPLPEAMLASIAKSTAGKTTGKKGAVGNSDATPPTKVQIAAIAKAAEAYALKSAQELKDLCKANKQVQSGSKTDLIQRCAEGKVLGQIPVCPLCGAGKLRFDIKTGIYKCPGYTDDETYLPCIFSSGSVQRNTWVE